MNAVVEKEDKWVMEVNGYPLTDEQSKILDAVKRGESIKVVAYAGAGKTSTLQAIAKYHVKPTAYLCYNKALAKEAETKFTDNYVTVKTAHSYAYQNVIYKTKKSTKNWQKKLQANNGKIHFASVKKYSGFQSGHEFPAKDGDLISAIRDTVTNYLNSADFKLTDSHQLFPHDERR